MSPPAGAFPEPVVDIAIEPKTKADQDKLGMVLACLAAEDPGFRFKTDEESGQTIISGTSELHLDMTVDRIRQEFGVTANVGAPQVAYREMITRTIEHEQTHRKQLGGSAQFARIKFRIEPSGSDGAAFACEGPARLLGEALAASVRRNVAALVESGPLIGFPIINVRFILIDAASDEPSGLALENAGRAGFREAVQKAGPKILEPIMKVEVVTPASYGQDVVDDLNSRRGRLGGTEHHGLTSVIRAIVPLSNMFGYVNSLRTLTNGRAQYRMTFDHYETVPAFPGNDGPFSGAMAMRA